MRELERWEFVYQQITGLYAEETCGGIRDEMVSGGYLMPFLERAYAARDRLCGRMGVDVYEDPDVDEMLRGFEELCRACGKLMYQYGWRDGRADCDEAPAPDA